MPPSFRRSILALALLSAPAYAAETATAPDCVDGEKPTEPISSLDKWGMQRYDAELVRYKRDHERYLRCKDSSGGSSDVSRKVDEAMQHPQEH